jgi:hypothetical protein
VARRRTRARTVREMKDLRAKSACRRPPPSTDAVVTHLATSQPPPLRIRSRARTVFHAVPVATATDRTIRSLPRPSCRLVTLSHSYLIAQQHNISLVRPLALSLSSALLLFPSRPPPPRCATSCSVARALSSLPFNRLALFRLPLTHSPSFPLPSPPRNRSPPSCTRSRSVRRRAHEETRIKSFRIPRRITRPTHFFTLSEGYGHFHYEFFNIRILTIVHDGADYPKHDVNIIS